MQICCCSLGRGRAYCAVHQGYSCTSARHCLFPSNCMPSIPCRRSPSPVERHYKATQQQRPSSCCEGYLHGPLSTAGIHGASPTHHSLTKQNQLLLEAAADLSSSADITSSSTGNCSISTAVPRPNLLGQLEADPGMRPKVLIKAKTNKPDLTHTTADIDGAQPHPKDVCHRPRDTNPLSPQYTLATGRCAGL